MTEVNKTIKFLRAISFYFEIHAAAILKLESRKCFVV